MPGDIRAERLFAACCAALTATAFTFACIAAVVDDLRIAFALTSAEVGLIAGAALWGLAIGQVLFAPLCDTLGMRMLLRCAFVGHLAGVCTLALAQGFAQLMAGAVILSTANGIVEATCNPLVATLYPDRKAVRLSQFHFWFPGGIMLGGLAVFALAWLGIGAWQAKVSLILLPTLLYGALCWRENYPLTEGRQCGLPVRAMLAAIATSPLMWLLLSLMAITASLELGPNRWVPSVLEAGGVPGILVLVFINGIMAALRSAAHRVLARVPPTAVLLCSVLVAGTGLMSLVMASTTMTTLIAAGVFAVGIAFLWPMMVGVVAERLPRTGALGLGLIAAVGAAFVGLFTTPMMGRIADEHVYTRLPAPATAALAHDVGTRGAPSVDSDARRNPVEDATLIRQAGQLSLEYRQTGQLPGQPAVVWLRRLIRADLDPVLTARAQALLRPAENAGGLRSFAALVPFAGLAALAFLALIAWDRRHGGYAAQVVRARLSITAAGSGGRPL